MTDEAVCKKYATEMYNPQIKDLALEAWVYFKFIWDPKQYKIIDLVQVKPVLKFTAHRSVEELQWLEP